MSVKSGTRFKTYVEKFYLSPLSDASSLAFKAARSWAGGGGEKRADELQIPPYRGVVLSFMSLLIFSLRSLRNEVENQDLKFNKI